MTSITQFIPGHSKKVSFEEALPEVYFSQDLENVFSENAISFLGEISKAILTSDLIRKYPEFTALGFWLRKSHLHDMILEFQKGLPPHVIVRPRGVVFHLAPANVDSIFFYSWALSILAGNINIVRVSENVSEPMLWSFDVIRNVLSDKHYQGIASRNRILTYGHDADINSFISMRSDVRVLWGGDQTVSAFRALSTKPTAKDITFADKISYSVIDTKKYLTLSEQEKNSTAHLFFNDAYWFNQMACSSPQVVYFSGPMAECKNASQLFWQKLQEEISKQNFSDNLSTAMEKISTLYEGILQKKPAVKSQLAVQSNGLTVLRIADDSDRYFERGCGGGFFFESFIGKLDDLKPKVIGKDQTLSYLGFEKEALKKWAQELKHPGINRIVPVGQVLNFSSIWDGYVLFNELTSHGVIL